jgi:hypothetical protein
VASGAAVEVEEAVTEGGDWEAGVGAEAGMDSVAATEQGFRIQGSVAWNLDIML